MLFWGVSIDVFKLMIFPYFHEPDIYFCAGLKSFFLKRRQSKLSNKVSFDSTVYMLLILNVRKEQT